MFWLIVVGCSIILLFTLFGVAADLGAIIAPLLDKAAKKCGLQSTSRVGDGYVGTRALVIEPFTSSSPIGKVELRGTVWSARLASEWEGMQVSAGSFVVIRALDGLTMVVAPERGASSSARRSSL